MSRIVLLLIAGLALAVSGFGIARMTEAQPTPALGAQDVRAIIEQVLAEREAAQGTEDPVEVATLDPAILNPMIESFLMDDPTILQRMSGALETRLAAEERERTSAALAGLNDKIYASRGDIVLGNPEGDVTLVEMFDYNCGFCRQALPDIAELLAEDPELRVILKEFPILSQGSLEAARISVLVGETDIDYWQFHEAMFTSPGQVDKDVALAAAEQFGLSRVSLELDMNTERVAQTIQTSYEIAQVLNITGTPTYIIGDEIIPGAIGVNGLRQRIANMRACGSTQCG